MYIQRKTRSANLDEDELALTIHPAEGVAPVSGHETPADGGSVVREEHETSVLALRDVREEVEPGIMVDEESLRVALLRAASLV